MSAVPISLTIFYPATLSSKKSFPFKYYSREFSFITLTWKKDMALSRVYYIFLVTFQVEKELTFPLWLQIVLLLYRLLKVHQINFGYQCNIYGIFWFLMHYATLATKFGKVFWLNFFE